MRNILSGLVVLMALSLASINVASAAGGGGIYSYQNGSGGIYVKDTTNGSNTFVGNGSLIGAHGNDILWSTSGSTTKQISIFNITSGSNTNIDSYTDPYTDTRGIRKFFGTEYIVCNESDANHCYVKDMYTDHVGTYIGDYAEGGANYISDARRNSNNELEILFQNGSTFFKNITNNTAPVQMSWWSWPGGYIVGTGRSIEFLGRDLFLAHDLTATQGSDYGNKFAMDVNGVNVRDIISFNWSYNGGGGTYVWAWVIENGNILIKNNQSGNYVWSVHDYQNNKTTTIYPGQLNNYVDLSKNLNFYDATNRLYSFNASKAVPIDYVENLPTGYNPSSPFLYVQKPDFSSEYVTSTKNPAYSSYLGGFLDGVIPSLETINNMQAADSFSIVQSPTGIQAGSNMCTVSAYNTWGSGCPTSLSSASQSVIYNGSTTNISVYIPYTTNAAMVAGSMNSSNSRQTYGQDGNIKVIDVNYGSYPISCGGGSCSWYCNQGISYIKKQYLLNTTTLQSYAITAPMFFISGNMFITYDNGTLNYYTYDSSFNMSNVRTTAAYLPPVKSGTIPEAITEQNGNVFFRYQSTDDKYYDFNAFGKTPFVQYKGNHVTTPIFSKNLTTDPVLYMSKNDGNTVKWDLSCQTPGYAVCVLNESTSTSECRSSTGVISPNHETCADGIVLDALAEKKYILNDSSIGNLRSKSGSTNLEFSDGQAVKNRFISELAVYPSEVRSFYSLKGVTSGVIAGTATDFKVDWADGVRMTKSQISGGALDGFMMVSRFKYLTNIQNDSLSPIQPIFWKSTLSDLTFASNAEFTKYGSGMGLYPIKAVGGTGALAYIQYPSGNLLCKSTYCSEIITPPVMFRYVSTDGDTLTDNSSTGGLLKSVDTQVQSAGVILGDSYYYFQGQPWGMPGVQMKKYALADGVVSTVKVLGTDYYIQNVSKYDSDNLLIYGYDVPNGWQEGIFKLNIHDGTMTKIFDITDNMTYQIDVWNGLYLNQTTKSFLYMKYDFNSGIQGYYLRKSDGTESVLSTDTGNTRWYIMPGAGDRMIKQERNGVTWTAFITDSSGGNKQQFYSGPSQIELYFLKESGEMVFYYYDATAAKYQIKMLSPDSLIVAHIGESAVTTMKGNGDGRFGERLAVIINYNLLMYNGNTVSSFNILNGTYTPYIISKNGVSIDGLIYDALVSAAGGVTGEKIYDRVFANDFQRKNTMMFLLDILNGNDADKSVAGMAPLLKKIEGVDIEKKADFLDGFTDKTFDNMIKVGKYMFKMYQ